MEFTRRVWKPEKMDIGSLRAHRLKKKGMTEEFPFGDHTLVFKVMGKNFALCLLDRKPFLVNLKCDQEKAQLLRLNFTDQICGVFHMNKKHWNSVVMDALPPTVAIELIVPSCDLVVQGLTKTQQQKIQNSE